MWCNRCFDKNGQPEYSLGLRPGGHRTHEDYDHVVGSDEYIDAKDLTSGDLFWTTYRNQPMYLRAISVRPSQKYQDSVLVVDSSHRSYHLPNSKRIQVQRLSDELKEKS